MVTTKRSRPARQRTRPSGMDGSTGRVRSALLSWGMRVRAAPLAEAAPTNRVWLTSQSRSLVEDSLDLGVVDVGLVVPVVAGVDDLRDGFTVEGLHCRSDNLLADADRVLGDGASHSAVVDRVHLVLAGVETDQGEIARHALQLSGLDATDGGAFVAQEDPLEVLVGLDDGGGDVSADGRVALSIL